MENFTLISKERERKVSSDQFKLVNLCGQMEKQITQKKMGVRKENLKLRVIKERKLWRVIITCAPKRKGRKRE